MITVTLPPLQPNSTQSICFYFSSYPSSTSSATHQHQHQHQHRLRFRIWFANFKSTMTTPFFLQHGMQQNRWFSFDTICHSSPNPRSIQPVRSDLQRNALFTLPIFLLHQPFRLFRMSSISIHLESIVRGV